MQALNRASYSAVVMPELTPTNGGEGRITDVVIACPIGLTKQMLEYSEVRR